MNEKHRLDRFLNQTLAEYSGAEPRAGLEHRILANLAAQQHERRLGRLWWWVAGPILSAAVVLVTVFALHPAPKHENVTANTKPLAVRPAPSPIPVPKHTTPERPAMARVQPKRKVRGEVADKAQSSSEPRLATFPADTGDEQQARLLLRFVVGHPEQAKEVVREEQQFRELAEANLNRKMDDTMEKQR
jgi:hypothetical protein